MKIAFVIVCSIFLFRVAQAFEENCGPDIRLDSPGKSMAHMPVLDQDGTGLCYAYSATQLIDAYRFSHGDTDYKHITSPIAAAVTNAIVTGKLNQVQTGKQLHSVLAPYTDLAFSKPDPSSGGDPTDVINSMRVEGLSCNHLAIRSSFNQSDYLRDLLEYFDRYNDWLSQQSLLKRAYLKTTGQFNSEAICTSDFKSKNISEIQTVVSQSVYESNPLKFLNSVINKACQNNVKKIDIPAAQSVTGEFMRAKGVNPALGFNRLLNFSLNMKNPQPVAIGICAQTLFTGVPFNAYTKDGGHEPYCEDHATVVIGRRTNISTGQCEFLVRNSLGTSCPKLPKNSLVSCKDGQFWVPSDWLTVSVYGATWIDSE